MPAHFSQVRQLWADATTEKILDFVSEKRPECGFYRKGEHIIGKCPFHDDSTPSFIITAHKGIAKCFGCDARYFNLIKFVQAISGPGCTFSAAAGVLRKRFGLKTAIPEALLAKLEAEDKEQQSKQLLVVLMGKIVLDAVRLWPDYSTDPSLYFAKDAIDMLMARKLGMVAPGELQSKPPVDKPLVDMMEEAETAAKENAQADPHGVYTAFVGNQLLGIMPPLSMLMNYYETVENGAEELQWARRYLGPYLDSKYQGYIVFPYHSEPGVISRFKIRSPLAREFYFIDDSVTSSQDGFLGYYGLHHNRGWFGQAAPGSGAYCDSTLICEGELDALSVYARQIRDASDDFVVLAMGGGAPQSLDRLVSYGIKKIYIIGDRDPGGDEFTKKVLNATTVDDFAYRMFRWPREYADWCDPTNPDLIIKDPDEAVRHLGYSKWRKYVCSTEGDNSSYIMPHEWAYEMAAVDLAKVGATDVKQKSSIAVEWGRLLRNQQETHAFAVAVARHHGLEPTYLVRDIFNKDENEEGFVRRLEDTLRAQMHFVGIRVSDTGRRVLVFYNKKKRVIDTMPLNDEKALEAVFSQYFGALYNFVRHEVGEPAFMTVGQDEGATFVLTARTKKYREYINFAILEAAHALPSLDHTPTKGQGYHYVPTESGEHKGYLVNGNNVYHFTHATDGLKVEPLEGPSHGDYLFNTADKAWLKSVKTEDLAAAFSSTDVDLVQLYDTVREMCNLGWDWKNKNLDAQFLAAHVLCLPVMAAFSRQTAIIINAEKASGKSRFLSGFVGGHQFPGIRVVEHSIIMSGYSEASIRQQRDGSTLCLCLEEFEDKGDGDRRSMQVRRVLDLTRDLISEQEVEWSIGTTSGVAKVYRLRFPLMCCAIHPLRDGASLSRFVNFELINTPSRMDPIRVLEEKWGTLGITRTRKALSTGLYKHVPRLREIQEEIANEFASGEKLPVHVPSRFREAMYPVLTMLRFLSELPGAEGKIPNYHQFAYDFSESRKDFLTRLNTTAENEQVFESLLDSPFKIQQSDDRLSFQISIREMLTDLNKLHEVNKTHQGVFFDAQQEWIVVLWVQATQGVLANTSYRNEKPVYLKQLSERHKHHIKTEDAVVTRLLERMTGVMGSGHSMDLVSVFSVKHLLDQTRDLWKSTGQPAPAPGTITTTVPSTESNGSSSPTHIDDMEV